MKTTVEIKDHPILFTGDMARAILEGRKTQTRRIIKIPEGIAAKYEYRGDDGGNKLQPKQSGHYWMNGYAMWRPKICPYGKVGDRLWVRETWAAGIEWDGEKPSEIDPLCGGHDISYLADGEKPEGYGKTRPSIYIPKWAARIWLEITAIRVERVRDISIEDMKAEGINRDIELTYTKKRDLGWYYYRPWRILWDSINARPKPVLKDGIIDHYVSYPWEDIQETREYRGKKWFVIGNPWVWVVEFKRLEKQENE